MNLPQSYANHCAILGVMPGDNWATIRSAYQHLIKRWHPDRFQDPEDRLFAEERTKEINNAYRALSDYHRQFGSLPVEPSPVVPCPAHGRKPMSRPPRAIRTRVIPAPTRRVHRPWISIGQLAHYGAMIEEHIRTAGPFREAAGRLTAELDDVEKRIRACSERQAVVIQRVDAIEARNRVADSNWEKLRSKGYLLESTK